MDSLSLPPEIYALLSSGIYPHPAEDVEVLQTHISYLIFAGPYVYKWKKPLRLGFLDFSSLAARRHFCHQEVRLNQRLCPTVYRGVVRLTREHDQFYLDGPGEVVEYGVKMHRLCAQDMMGVVMDRRALDRQHIDKILKRLVPFYEQAEVQHDPAGYGGYVTVARAVEENFTETSSFVGSSQLSKRRYSALKQYNERILRDPSIFHSRVRGGRVRDCHGDLHSGNICLAEEVAIFDCIEFNERFRITDIAADIAFLAMDLDLHNFGEMSDYFISQFINATGDRQLLDVLNFYKCYRAYVRGKIGMLTAADPAMEPDAARHAREMAQAYFQLAEEYVT